MRLPAFLLFITLASIVRADLETDVRAQCQALAEQPGYSWETTRRGFAAERPQRTTLIPLPSLTRSPAVQVQGRFDRATYTEIVELPTIPLVPVPLRIYLKPPARAVGFTPFGWVEMGKLRTLSRTHRDDEYPFEGKSIRLSALVFALQRAALRLTPVDEVKGLLSDVVHFREEHRAIVGTLKPAAAEMMLGDFRPGPSGGLVSGEVIFRQAGGILCEFECRITVAPPPNSSGARTPPPTTTHWKTTITAIGRTQVTPPREAFDVLEGP